MIYRKEKFRSFFFSLKYLGRFAEEQRRTDEDVDAAEDEENEELPGGRLDEEGTEFSPEDACE